MDVMTILVLNLGEGSQAHCCRRQSLLAPGEGLELFQAGKSSDGLDGVFVQVKTSKIRCAADVQRY